MIEESRRRLKMLRAMVMTVGEAMMIAALLADWIKLSAPGSFGKGQILLFLAGFIVSLIGLLVQRIVALYRGVAIVTLNTLVLLACLESGAMVATRWSAYQARGLRCSCRTMLRKIGHQSIGVSSTCQIKYFIIPILFSEELLSKVQP